MIFNPPMYFPTPAAAGGSVTVLGTSTPTTGTTDTTTVSYNLSASSNCIVVTVNCWFFTFSTPSISSVTWNGVSMSSAVSILGQNSSFYVISAIYTLLSPTTGTQNLVVTVSSGATNYQITPQILALSGVAASSIVAATNSANASGNDTVSLSTSSATNAIRIGARSLYDGSGTLSFTAGGSTTISENIANNGVGGTFGAYSSSSPSGSFTLSSTWAGGGTESADAAVVAAIKAA